MKERIKNIKSKLEELLAIAPFLSDSSRLDELEQFLENTHQQVIDFYLQEKLNSKEWTQAADPGSLCGDSERDRRIRASAIYTMFVASRLKKEGKRFLDYGCGEGYVVQRAQKLGDFAVGYDIEKQGWDKFDDLNLTTDLSIVLENSPYDVVLLYDVLDHVIDRDPVEILEEVKSLLTPQGMVVVRFHPWSCKHGTHLWKLNKTFAHLVFTDEELEKMGYTNMLTNKVKHPREVYPKWIRDAGFKVTWQNITYEQAGPIFENNPPLKARMLRNFDRFGYHDIEEVFRDVALVKAK